MPSRLDISEELTGRMRLEIARAGRGERSLLVGEFARQVGCSPATLWRKLSLTGGARRIERGTSHPDSVIMQLTAIKTQAGLRGRAQRYLTDEETIRIGEEAGIIEPGSMSPSWFRARRNKLGYNLPRAYTAHEDRYVNQVQYMDFSVSEYFGVVAATDDGDHLVKVLGSNPANPYKNKPDEAKLRLWLASVVESHSRMTVFRYIPSAGENLAMAAEFLNWAWYRQDERLPALNLPDTLHMDQGPIEKSADFSVNLAEILGVQVVGAASKSDREAHHQSQGKVERRFRTIWRQENAWGYLLERKGINRIKLSELNELAYEHCLKLAQQGHPRRRNTTVAGCYQAGLQSRAIAHRKGELEHGNRSLDIDMRYVLWKRLERTPDATGMVWIDNVPYVISDKRFVLGRIRVLVGTERIRGTAKDPVTGAPVFFDVTPFDADNAPAVRPSATMRQEASKLLLDADFTNVRIMAPANSEADETPVRHIGTMPKPVAPATAFTDPAPMPVMELQAARVHLCELLDMRWHDIPESVRDLVELAYNNNRLTRDLVADLAKVVGH